jgi:hypothetical protein
MLVLFWTIDRLIKCKTGHERFSDFGERAYLARGENLNVIYWDAGNGWCLVLQVLPRNSVLDKEFRSQSIEFFQGLREADDE